MVTATLLTTTISTPIWGKLADLVDRKLLLQLSLAIFVIASALAGFSQDTEMLITMRVLQGIGAGGITALSQVVIADIISPRERGKYMGLMGAIMAVGMVGGPLIGGFITDTIGWRWNFFVALPFAVVAIWLIQRTLHLPELAKRKVKIDYFGIILLSAGVSLLLIWVSMAGTNFEWASPTTAWMVGGSVLSLIAFVVVEIRATEPLINLGLFKNATFTLAVIASLSVGVTMFGTSVFLSQYMIMARGATATSAGLMTLPMMAGVLVISTVAGAMISRFGKWKAFVVAGSIMQTIGLFAPGHHPLRHELPVAFRLHVPARCGCRHGHAEHGAGGAERGSAEGTRRCQLRRDVLPLPGRNRRRCRPGLDPGPAHPRNACRAQGRDGCRAGAIGRGRQGRRPALASGTMPAMDSFPSRSGRSSSPSTAMPWHRSSPLPHRWAS